MCWDCQCCRSQLSAVLVVLASLSPLFTLPLLLVSSSRWARSACGFHISAPIMSLHTGRVLASVCQQICSFRPPAQTQLDRRPFFLSSWLYSLSVLLFLSSSAGYETMKMARICGRPWSLHTRPPLPHPVSLTSVSADMLSTFMVVEPGSVSVSFRLSLSGFLVGRCFPAARFLCSTLRVHGGRISLPGFLGLTAPEGAVRRCESLEVRCAGSSITSAHLGRSSFSFSLFVFRRVQDDDGGHMSAGPLSDGYDACRVLDYRVTVADMLLPLGRAQRRGSILSSWLHSLFVLLSCRVVFFRRVPKR
jgi:hypothetical protein